MRELFHPTIDQLCLSMILNALGDPIRLNIIKNLAIQRETTCACCNINLTKSALSHHFKVLREAGLINVRIDGKQRFLSIRYDDLEGRFPGLLNTIINCL
ncbi:MAG: putative transcriptional regulator [Herbinix sp.]|jgi:DNA-binding transcriptional ArsR family regulator|nr:putative transcriptional regulator [Herbinix sp.]